MKKTIVTLLALSGIAMAADQQKVLELPTSVSIVKGGDINNKRPFAGIGNYTVERVQSIISQIGTVEAGKVYWGTGQGGNQSLEVFSTIGTEPGTIDVAMKSRPALEGEWLMISVAALDNTTALTLNFTPSHNVGCAIFDYNATDGLTLLKEATLCSANQQAVIATEGLKLGANDIIMLGLGTKVSGEASGNTVVNLQAMKLTATVASSPVPEPATGALSLLALAGLCIRRRK